MWFLFALFIVVYVFCLMLSCIDDRSFSSDTLCEAQKINREWAALTERSNRAWCADMAKNRNEVGR